MIISCYISLTKRLPLIVIVNNTEVYRKNSFIYIAIPIQMNISCTTNIFLIKLKNKIKYKTFNAPNYALLSNLNSAKNSRTVVIGQNT